MATFSLRAYKRYLLILGALLLLLWLLFLDSHSIYKRWKWSRELQQIKQTNQQLELRIRALQQELSKPLSDETVERIAREEYGMHRKGETVYRIQEQ